MKDIIHGLAVLLFKRSYTSIVKNGMNMKITHKINWKNAEERLSFENDLKNSKAEKKERSLCDKIVWFFGIFILPIGLVITLYGPCAYFIVLLATEKKKEEELKLLQMCNNGSQLEDSSEKCDPTELEYDDLLNYILINIYPYITLFCQGGAFLMASLWHVIDYRQWNLLGGIISQLCLPVDILIFYLEPLGFVGTTAAMVLGFGPYVIIIADAAFPVKPMIVVANGNIVRINRNSWTEDISISYNQRYNFVARVTLTGWTAFSTLALCMALFKGSTFNENALGAVILALECVPQMIGLALVMIHWDANFDQHGFELFESLVDMPLVLWYLSFYCSPRTRNAVIGKVFLNSFSMFIHRYADYAEKYVYEEGNEIEKTEGNMNGTTEIKHSTRCGLPAYNISKFTNVCAHHIVYLLACPFVGIWECFNALKSAFIRDFK